MRRWIVVIAVLVAADARAVPALAPRRDPIADNCPGPRAWPALRTCIETHDKSAAIEDLSADARMVSTRSRDRYVYVRIGDAWRLAYQPGDEGYELAQRAALTIGKQPAVRIDLSHHVVLGNDSVFFERVTLVCTEGTAPCQALVTACTVITHGRAVETFRGGLLVTGDDLAVTGDRTHIGQICAGR